LLAEKILDMCHYFDGDEYEGGCKNGYKGSKIRAFLNGLGYKKNNSLVCNDYLDCGFLQTAFTFAEQASIADICVDNSERSANTDANAARWNGGHNQYAYPYTEKEKIFLLSVQEVTKCEYGFEVCKKYGEMSSRCIAAADFARAKSIGVWTQDHSFHGYLCLLRSPYYGDEMKSVVVNWVGEVGDLDPNCREVNLITGVVPALCLEN
jgi:hypothetical protein